MEKPKETKKKARSDKGSIRVTKRDLECIQWIAEQYAARSDQIQRLLSRYPDPKHPFQDKKMGLASASTTREQIGRWHRAGWIVYKRVLANGPGWAYVTRAGLHLVDLHDEFLARAPSPKRLEHIYAVNQVRLWMEEEEQYVWQSERWYRANLSVKRGESSGPIPDGVIWTGDEKVAIEVQLSELKPKELEKKCSELLKHMIHGEDGISWEDAFPLIWMYFPTEKTTDAALVVVNTFYKEYQDRVEIMYEDDLLMQEEVDAWK